MENNNILSTINSKIVQPDSKQVQLAISTLDEYMTLMQNNNRLFQSGVNLQLNGEYNDLSLKRSSLIESKVCKADFINTALTTSFFSDVYFKDSKFNESNMQYCQFSHNTFRQIKIYSTNLSYSNFYNTEFLNVKFKGSTVSEILFEQCTFENCIFTSSMLENAIFVQCKFKDVKFINTNIEYMELRNCEFDDVYFPMAQISYVFGLFQNILENKNSIKLWTDKTTITLDKYKELKDALITYYISISEYFPLANLYLADYELDNAYKCIALGIKDAIEHRNFRMLKFFCKLAKQGDFFEHKKLKELYMLIEKYVSEMALNIYEQRSFIHNIGEIRSILLDSIHDFPTARIVMQTNIDSSESDKIIEFINYIDDILCQFSTQKISHIEYRHNSDANFVAFISANYKEILLIVNVFLILSNNVIDAVQKKILNHQQIVLNQLEINEKKKQEEIKKKKEQLHEKDIQYTMQYIIDSPTTDSHDINIYL